MKDFNKPMPAAELFPSFIHWQSDQQTQIQEGAQDHNVVWDKAD